MDAGTSACARVRINIVPIRIGLNSTQAVEPEMSCRADALITRLARGIPSLVITHNTPDVELINPNGKL